MKIKKAQRLWQLGFLKEVATSSKNTGQKLLEIENLWARFGYLETWNDFIYYMPNEKLFTKDRESIYNLFLKFLEEEEKRMKI